MGGWPHGNFFGRAGKFQPIFSSSDPPVSVRLIVSLVIKIWNWDGICILGNSM